MLWFSARRFEGSQLQGANLWDWDAHLYDAFEVLNVEYIKVENAMFEADNRHIIY